MPQLTEVNHLECISIQQSKDCRPMQIKYYKTEPKFINLKQSKIVRYKPKLDKKELLAKNYYYSSNRQSLNLIKLLISELGRFLYHHLTV